MCYDRDSESTASTRRTMALLLLTQAHSSKTVWSWHKPPGPGFPSQPPGHLWPLLPYTWKTDLCLPHTPCPYSLVDSTNEGKPPFSSLFCSELDQGPRQRTPFVVREGLSGQHEAYSSTHEASSPCTTQGRTEAGSALGCFDVEHR